MYITLKEIYSHTANNSWYKLFENIQYDDNQKIIDDEFDNENLKNQPLKLFRTYSKSGLSLLRPLPKYRTCESANIDINYCSFKKMLTLNKNQGIPAGKHVIVHLNNLFKIENASKLCAELKFDRVKNFYKILDYFNKVIF